MHDVCDPCLCRSLEQRLLLRAQTARTQHFRRWRQQTRGATSTSSSRWMATETTNVLVSSARELLLALMHASQCFMSSGIWRRRSCIFLLPYMLGRCHLAVPCMSSCTSLSTTCWAGAMPVCKAMFTSCPGVQSTSFDQDLEGKVVLAGWGVLRLFHAMGAAQGGPEGHLGAGGWRRGPPDSAPVHRLHLPHGACQERHAPAAEAASGAVPSRRAVRPLRCPAARCLTLRPSRGASLLLTSLCCRHVWRQGF